MNYPDHLLPKPDYKIIENIAETANCFLIRNTPTREFCIPGTKLVNPELVEIQSNHLGDFSTNLLGIYTEYDIRYQIIGNAQDYFHSLWLQGEEVDAPTYQNDFDVNENKGCFYLSIDEINGQSVNYPQDNPKIEACCKVIHTPTKCNFWHFSIRWYNNDGIDIRDLGISKNQRRRFLSLTKSLVIELALIDKPVNSIISPDLYKND